ncbi:MAG: DUF3299 domain-containing protein [Deltaproteobacteria bacterium]|jgi:hypothetical protein|nr:DUF3299 domain-containing protein [Deltaproteobacteria bacterium]
MKAQLHKTPGSNAICFLAALAVLAALAAGSAAAVQAERTYRENGWLIWDELVDPSWDPAKIFQELGIDKMRDDDPRAEEAVRSFMERWSQAPVNPAMGGQAIKIPGFVVPLDMDGAELREFFLVPYFGACIHVPPPPPNQIIYVKSDRPIEGVGVMDVVFAYGIIRSERFSSELGDAGYTLAADKVEPYREDG